MDLRPYDEQPVRKRGPGFFWWSIFLLLLSGACFTSWLGSFYVVGHPENPKCYRFLKKLYWKKSKADQREAWLKQFPQPYSADVRQEYNKVFANAFRPKDLGAPPLRFKVTEAPKGKFLTPTKLLEEYGKLGAVELERENAELLRAYLTNYTEVKRNVPYVVGKYDVVRTFPLEAADMFPSGAAVIAQAIEYPQLLVEMIFTAEKATVPLIQDALPIGRDFVLERARDLFALLHVERRADGRMQFTTIPLPYGGWQQKGGGASFTLTSPADLERFDRTLTLHLEAGLPVVKGAKLEQGLAEYAAHRRKTLASASGDQAALAAPELVRFEVSMAEPGAAAARVVRQPRSPASSETPSSPPPAPAASPSTRQNPLPAPNHPRTLTEPPPAVPLPPRAAVVRAPEPAPPAPIRATPVAEVPATHSVPAPAVEPPVPVARRVLTTEQASAMVEDFDPNGRALLAGEFIVTGVLGQRAALRTRDSLRDAKADPTQPGTGAALIVVDYPTGTPPPTQDSTLTRTGETLFEIRNVVRRRDGQIVIVVTERSR